MTHTIAYIDAFALMLAEQLKKLSTNFYEFSQRWNVWLATND